MATRIVAPSNRAACPSVGRCQLARRKCVAVAALHHQNSSSKGHDSTISTLSRRQALLGVALSVAVLDIGPVAPAPALAKGAEKKEPTIINDPAVLKTQLEAQYQLWSSGQFDTWLAGQPETLKWQSTYNGVPLKLKGKAGAKQYFTALSADLDIQSYKPLAIFVDNDGDEATVVVEATGVSRRTQQPFKTIFLHAYTIGPMGQILKFKETTDAALLAQLIPPQPAAAGAEGSSTVEAPAGAPAQPVVEGTASAAAAGEGPMEQGAGARTA